MKPTRKRVLVYLAVLGLLCAITLSRVFLATSDTLMPVHSAAPIAAAVMCAALLWWTLIVRRRLLHIARAKHAELMRAKGAVATPFIMREKPLEPLVAARTVALAFAASRAGAYVCGWYAGVAISFFGHLGGDDVRLRLVYAVTTALLSLGIVIIAVWLERSCQLPTPPAGAEASPA